jgi:hypothetical protein
MCRSAALVAVAGWLAVACSSDVQGTAVAGSTEPSSTSSSPRTTTSPSPTPTTTTTPTTSTTALASGPVVGDVADIVAFDDPASQLQTDDDLIAYLMPGLAGPGVDCVSGELDVDDVLAQSFDDGGTVVARTVADCVDDDSLGILVAMYAVGFEPDGAELFEAIDSCAADAVGELPTDDAETLLQDIFTARLDLVGPPTSRTLAADFLVGETECLAELATPTPTTPASIEPPPPPPPTTATEVPPPTTPGGNREVQWQRLVAGDCLPTLPAGQFTTLTVGDCAVPHAAEVVGTDSFGTFGNEDVCDEEFQAYTGQAIAQTSLVVDILEAVDTFGNTTVVCVASQLSAEPLVGSLKAG